MMHMRWRMGWVVLIVGGGMLLVKGGVARGQMGGMKRPLGGYGAATVGSYYRSTGGPLIPYAGGQGGFIPYEGISSGRSEAVLMAPREIPRTSIGGAGMGGTPIGGASRMQGADLYRPLNYRGRFGQGGASRLNRNSGPGFGSPFRNPPSLTRGM